MNPQSTKSSRPDWLETIRSSFLHRVESDRDFRHVVTAGTHSKTTDRHCLQTLATEVEEMAGRAQSLRTLSSETHAACRKELSCLPRPIEICQDASDLASGRDTFEKQAASAVSATLDRLGLAVPWRIPLTPNSSVAAQLPATTMLEVELANEVSTETSSTKTPPTHGAFFQPQRSKVVATASPAPISQLQQQHGPESRPATTKAKQNAMKDRSDSHVGREHHLSPQYSHPSALASQDHSLRLRKQQQQQQQQQQQSAYEKRPTTNAQPNVETHGGVWQVGLGTLSSASHTKVSVACASDIHLWEAQQRRTLPKQPALANAIQRAMIRGSVRNIALERTGNVREAVNAEGVLEANVSELLLCLRNRMASRIQRAWGRSRARRMLSCKIACKKMASIRDAFHRKVLSDTWADLRKLAEAKGYQAACVICRFTRGWLARKRCAQMRQWIKTVSDRCYRIALRRLASVLRLWAMHVRAIVRWTHLVHDVEKRRPPQHVFRQLLPMEGKTAVARAQHEWTLRNRAILGWLNSQQQF